MKFLLLVTLFVFFLIILFAITYALTIEAFINSDDEE